MKAPDIDRLRAQRDEFLALRDLWKAFDAMPPVVDDDYPEMRHYYEGALQNFLKACAKNGRQLPNIGGADHGSKAGS